MPMECADQISVPAIEARHDIVQRPTHLILVKGKDAPQHGSRSGVLALETFLPGDK
jgi:hypothetical protein